MSIAQTILPQFDHEIATTRRVLERLPAERMGWKPHPKSWTLGELSSHIATIPGWGAAIMALTELDPSPKPGDPAPERATSAASAVDLLGRNAAKARAAIAAASDADFHVPWSLKLGGAIVFTMPRVAVVRGFVLSHLIHHRGELMVYLRLCDVPLPSVYGPTADEG
jgi:uncharacterized damage-inducible protein DinB